MTFGTFGHAKVRERKSFFKYLRGRTMFDPYNIKSKYSQQKKLSKRKRRNKISRSAEHDHRCRWTPPPFEKGGRKLYREQTKILLQKKKRAQKSDGCPPLFIIPFFRPFSLSAVLPFHRKQTVYFRPMQLPLRLFSAGLSSAFPRRGACRF